MKLFIKFFALVLLFVSFVKGEVFAGTDGYAITVNIRNYNDSIIFLAKYYGDKQYIQDTVKRGVNGVFFIHGTEPLDGGVYIIATSDKRYFEMVVDKEQQFSVDVDNADFIGSIKFKGSQENNDYYDYLHFINPRGMKLDSLNKASKVAETMADSLALVNQMKNISSEIDDYKAKYIADHPTSLESAIFNALEDVKIPDAPILPNGRPDSTFAYRYYKTHFWDHIDLTDDRLVRTPIYASKLKQYLDNLTVQDPDSINKEADFLVNATRKSPELFKYTVFYLTYNYETSKIMGMDAVFVHMATTYYTHPKDIFWLDSAAIKKIVDRGFQLQPLELGKKAPNLTFRDLNNNPVSIYSVNAPYTVLYFWSYECSHCKVETPILADTMKKWMPLGVHMFAVQTEYNLDSTKNNINRMGLTMWQNVHDMYNETNFRHVYDIYSTPVIYLLDKDKTIIAKRISVEQLDMILNKYINGRKSSD